MTDEAAIRDAKPCPFCGGILLYIETWSDDDGDFDVIACEMCEAAAPKFVWNIRQGTTTGGGHVVPH